ncbi:MAG: hypothetical protein HDR32_03970 [Treponema sp.]|nr:hypothetical protein [Treponema sp.]
MFRLAKTTFSAMRFEKADFACSPLRNLKKLLISSLSSLSQFAALKKTLYARSPSVRFLSARQVFSKK